MKEITLTFNNTTTTLTSDEEGRYNLNDLHRLSGYSASKRPGNWKTYAVNIINEYSNARILAFETKRGNGGGTWAIEPLVYVYASYLSADFHKAVLDAFTAAVNGDGKKAVKKAQSVAFINEISMDGIPSFKITRGKIGGTWAHPDIALAYAAVIDIIHQF